MCNRIRGMTGYVRLNRRARVSAVTNAEARRPPDPNSQHKPSLGSGHHPPLPHLAFLNFSEHTGQYQVPFGSLLRPTQDQ